MVTFSDLFPLGSFIVSVIALVYNITKKEITALVQKKRLISF